MIITKEAITQLAMLNSSCRSPQEKKMHNLLYIYQCAKAEKELDFSSFINDFPERSLTYRLLEHFAKESGEEQIDERLVWRFFGGNTHIQFVREQIFDWNYGVMNRGRALKESFKNKFFFAHLLVPIEIRNVNPVISGVYLNAGEKIWVRGLVVHPFFRRELRIGDKVLAHYATILSPADNLIQSWLRNEQRNSDEFMAVVSQLKEIDYRSFWSLKEWTEDILRQCGF